jgi:hypothetical protein
LDCVACSALYFAFSATIFASSAILVANSAKILASVNSLSKRFCSVISRATKTAPIIIPSLDL